MVSVKNVRENNSACHDCQKEIQEKEGSLINGFLLTYQKDGERLQAYKCRECFRNNPSLNNFRECEVYSRVCGYLRPVVHWNEAKREEFAERKIYKTPEL